MKFILASLVLFNSFICRAECDAPALNLKLQKGEIYGFSVIKLWGNESDPKVSSSDTKISFGDYEFLFTAIKSQQTKPKEVKIDKEDVSKKLLKVFKPGTHYLGKEKQRFSITNIQGIDLQDKGSADVILFEVSPGANAYSGAIGILNGNWVEIIQPSCY